MLPPCGAHYSLPVVIGCADKKFVNKMSRVIIACQDGGRRSEIAAEMVTGLGYTAIAIIEGGVEEYLKVSPLKDADKKARVARVEQFVGVKYGGTGVTSDATPGERPTHALRHGCAIACDLHADALLRGRQTTARKRLCCTPQRDCRGSVAAALRGDCARSNMECGYANTRAASAAASAAWILGHRNRRCAVRAGRAYSNARPP